MSDKVHDQARDPKSQDVIRCKVKIYKLSNNMQRCPYIHEMKERLLGEQIPMEPVPKKIPTPPPFNMDQQQLLQQQPVATIVKLNPDGYGSHTSPTHHRADRTPLMPKQPEDEFHYVERTSYPKNAKTSLFIIMSFVYAKILVVICVASVISDVVTHNIPLYEYYYEGFFTYLYGMSILFLLYVFCFLLQESTCCSGGEKEVVVKKPSKQKAKEKEKEKKKEEEKKKKEEKERQKKEKKEKEKEKDKNKDKKDKKQEKREKLPRKMRDVVQQRSTILNHQSTYRRNSEGVVDSSVPVPVAELENQSQVDTLQEQTPAAPAPPPAAPQPLPSAAGNNSVDVEAGTVVKVKRKRKTTQNDQSHGSFFLRIGAIAFGLGTMIYNGLEFGTFFEVPFTPACYMILRGVNPLLQMIFTFMQMYFIFMNSRLNIHRFKVVARFGLMHVVATNICVWIRTLLDNIKEITNHHWKMLNDTFPTIAPTPVPIQQNPFRATAAKAITEIPHVAATTLQNLVQSTARTAATKLNEVATTLPTTTTTTLAEEASFPEELVNSVSENGTELIQDIIPQAFRAFNFSSNTNDSCARVNIMGTIVQDSAPYLFPFIIEYSLIGAAVIYVMWKHIGRNPRYVTQEDLEHRLEIMLSRRAVAMAQAHQGRVDCVGASKGLFFGLLMLVASLICLILFFVLIHHRDFGLLAIYLADVSHCVLMVLSIFAIIIGFIRMRLTSSRLNCRVQHLKFKTEEQSDLNDILLRVSAFGLFLYAVFSVIAGHLNAFTKEPNLLVMITGVLSVVQVLLQLLFIADVSRRRVHLPEHDRSKPGRQVVTFLLICNVTMWIIYTFETQKVEANPVQLEFYGFLAWAIVQRITLPLCIFHRFHSAVTLAEIWKTSYKARLE
ncbi:uncharacterized protein LOC109597712 isoform X5 [Aethina tumida]|uniref:uncharacterized protein LOC109597712 isoform X5 n=1 Tax=Aethina tumida TaxID=116153 RepID=UPI0021486F06|nr:uncharacterized protein LOC109597712 isoform X5 [Aethina tumida]